jgi:ketosteroid isomerase-like protein
VEFAQPDIEFVPITAALEGQVLRGHDAIRKFIQGLNDDWELFDTDPQQYFEIGDVVLVLGTWHARGRQSGLQFDSQPGAWLAQLRDKRIQRWRTFTDRGEALAEVGLGEAELDPYRVRPRPPSRSSPQA